MKKFKAFPVTIVKALDVKADPVEGQLGEFEAIVSVFGNVDQVGDRVVKGAFDATLKEWAGKSDLFIPVWYSHQYGSPENLIGRVTAAEERDEGLYVKGELFIGRKARAADVYGDFKDGVLAQFSFAYDVVREKKVGDVNELLELELHEVGPTPLGANRDTRLLAVKSDEVVFALRMVSRDDADMIRQLACPKCGEWADIDDDQYHGRVSVHHDTPECGYHETHDFSAGEITAVEEPEPDEDGKAGLADGSKRGRVLNAKNETLLRDAHDALAAVLKSLEPKSGRTLSAANEAKVKDARDLVAQVLAALDEDDSAGKGDPARGVADELADWRMRLDLTRAKTELETV